MDSAREAWEAVLAATRSAVPHLPELQAFIGRDLPGPETYRAHEATPLPVLKRLPEARAASRPEFLPLIDALIEHGEHLHWIRSYTAGDGVDQYFLDNYGYLNIASEVGPFVWDGPRVMIGLWGPGLVYDEHWHEPEELYATIAGGAVFRSPGRAPRHVGPGDCVHHAPNQVHATHMVPGPFLALVAWAGANLMRRASVGAGFGKGAGGPASALEG